MAISLNNLANIYQWVGLPTEQFTGNFKSTEHHILGNRMRNASSKIRIDERWRTDLDDKNKHRIERYLKHYCDNHPHSALASIIDSYLNDSGNSGAITLI